MGMEVKVPALEKLLDIVASGIGSVAGPMLAPWKARREGDAKRIGASADADVLLIHAEAQAKARELLVPHHSISGGDLSISDRVQQRILFQEQKRQRNIESVVRTAAAQLGDKTVNGEEPDHDWTARFFNSVQDVSSEDMQALWARVLSGEVERKGTTSVRTLGILRNLDQATAMLFKRLCSAAVFLGPEPNAVLDARVPSLGGNAAKNALKAHGLGFGALNRLNEHGLIIADYNSWHDYQIAIGLTLPNSSDVVCVPFWFQGKCWFLVPEQGRSATKQYKLSGVALTMSGRELAKVIDFQPMEEFAQDLSRYFKRHSLQMLEGLGPHIVSSPE